MARYSLLKRIEEYLRIDFHKIASRSLSANINYLYDANERYIRGGKLVRIRDIIIRDMRLNKRR